MVRLFDSLRFRYEHYPLFRRVLLAYQTWTPTVTFGLTMHLLFGLSFLASALQHQTGQSIYTRTFDGHLWWIGIVFVALYGVALAYPIRGALLAIAVYCMIGMIVSIADRATVGIGLYTLLPVFAFRTTRRKHRLLSQVQEWRVTYEDTKPQEADAELTAIVTAAELAAEVALQAARVSATNRARLREMARKLRECQLSLREVRPEPPAKSEETA